MILSRVSAATSGLSRNAREIVAVERPRLSAIVDSLTFWATAFLPKRVSLTDVSV
ncbi:hypothetical protein AGR4B_Lc10344 [Agrobacterium tumefaciens str. CFBP 5621]|nr:hypothetical protein AGR4B_Lc10344 [Agrobacterium tumefaciens str. CFBP 5621]